MPYCTGGHGEVYAKLTALALARGAAHSPIWSLVRARGSRVRTPAEGTTTSTVETRPNANGSAMSAVLAQLHHDLDGDLRRIAARFKPGAKLTLVVRSPNFPGDTGVVLTDDNLDLAIAEIRKLQGEQAIERAMEAERKPTQVQLDTLTFMRSYMGAHGGVPPTLREIREHFGLRSLKAVHDRLVALEKKGLAQRMPSTTRNWRPA